MGLGDRLESAWNCWYCHIGALYGALFRRKSRFHRPLATLSRGAENAERVFFFIQSGDTDWIKPIGLSAKKGFLPRSGWKLI